MSDYPKGTVVPCANQSCEFLVMNAEGGWAHVDTHGKPTDHKAAPKPVTASTPPLVDVIAEVLAGHHHFRYEVGASLVAGCSCQIDETGAVVASLTADFLTHQARAVLDALSEAGGVEWGLFRRGGDQGDVPLDNRTFTTEAAARKWAGRCYSDLSWLELRFRIAGPWTAVEG